ncbi:MAG: hypothetical protein JXR97_07180 [Planctomycetes bacterium]|nr:hypothetical protein [Planctomycetota bacterium]
MNTIRTILSALAIVAIATGSVYAEEGQGKGKGEGKGKAIRAEMKAAAEAFKTEIKTHMEKQKAENKTFRESQKDSEDVSSIITACKTHRETQYQENKTFASEMHTKRIAKIKEIAAKYEVPEDKLAKHLSHAEESYKAMVAHRETQHKENMAFLDGLAAKEGLTKKELVEAIKGQMKTQCGENKEFHKQNRARKGKGANTEE